MTRLTRCFLMSLLVTGVAVAAESQPKPYSLDTQLIEDGWIMLFDGQTPFGWKLDDGSKVGAGMIIVAGGEKGATAQTDTEFSAFDLVFVYKAAKAKGIKLVLNGKGYDLEAAPKGHDLMEAAVTVQGGEKNHSVGLAFASVPEGKNAGKALQPKRGKKVAGPSLTTIGFTVPAGETLEISRILLKPLGGKSIFNGKDLTGWKEVPGKKSKFSVTDKGELNIKDGPGDIQTEGQWDDFVLQLDILSSGEHLNSGVFFRALPGEFWQGYEAQIRNEWKGYERNKPRDSANEDRTKPIDFGTGAIYNRQPSRKVVSDDNEWYTMTIIARGPHAAVWVNGYQTADYVDEQKDAPTARKGRFLGKGCVSLQGHDPTTNMSFRNIRIAPLPKKEKAG